jgi:hypothetical protein
MQKPQIVTHLLVPTDEEAPEAIHPTMRAFYHPPPGLETYFLFERLRLLPSREDVRRDPELLQQIPHSL